MHAITMTDFAFERFAAENPTVSFVHSYPGLVKTGFIKELTHLCLESHSHSAAGFYAHLAMDGGYRRSGKRQFYATTSAAYPPKAGERGAVEVEDGNVKQGSAGEIGNGVYLIGFDGKLEANETVLKELRGTTAGAKNWAHTIEDIRER